MNPSGNFCLQVFSALGGGLSEIWKLSKVDCQVCNGCYVELKTSGI